MALFWLSDEAWAAIEPHYRGPSGARRVDDCPATEADHLNVLACRFFWHGIVTCEPCRLLRTSCYDTTSLERTQSWRFAPLLLPRLLEYSPGWSKRTQRRCDAVNEKAAHWFRSQHSLPHSSRLCADRTRKPSPGKALLLKYSKYMLAPEDVGVVRLERTPLVARAFARSWPVAPLRKHFLFHASKV